MRLLLRWLQRARTMPLYEYRCAACDAITSLRCAIAARPKTVDCDHCGRPGATQILTGGAVHRDSASKAARLDPKYERMVDRAMRNTQHADPDRILRRLKPFPKDE
jgi:putative FmdB family regulatory protein